MSPRTNETVSVPSTEAESGTSKSTREPLSNSAAEAEPSLKMVSYQPSTSISVDEPTPEDESGLGSSRRSLDPPLPTAQDGDGIDDEPQQLEAARLEPLLLDDVIQSVQQTYPLLINASLDRRIAAGKQISAQGEFDLTAKAFSISAPLGFYENYRNGVSLNQPIFDGGYLYSGYKIGDGNFQPWFKERETDEGGEFSVGVGVPLLKDRAIDKRRAALFQANLARQAVEPAIQAQLLEFVRAATQAYWTWVAAGRSLSAQQELLENAAARVQQIETRVLAGDLTPIVRINNDQLVASRETKVIESERKLQKAAIKLSLFYRTPSGDPIVPELDRVLEEFPDPSPLDSEQLEADISMAISASPVLQELDLAARSVRVELSNARNMLLPKFDAQLLAAQDVGGAASSKGDKSPFELEAGLYGEVPLQRREARGKITSACAKLSQIDVKREFVINKITAAVRDAYSALFAAVRRIDRAKTNLRLARETLRLGQIQFEAGNISLIELNIYEKSVTDAQLLLVDSEAEYFLSLADYRAALSLAPLDVL